MKRFAFALAWGLLASGCKGPGEAVKAPAAPPAPEPLRVDFSPAPGKTLTERTLTVRAEAPIAPAAPSPPYRESVEAVLKSSFEQAPGGGWVLTQQVASLQAKGNDQVIQNKLTELVQRFPMKLALAADGAFVRYLNPEAAEAAVRALFDQPGQAEAVLPYFAPRALEEQARREWDAKYGGLFNRNLTPGVTAFYGVETVSLSSGAQLAYGVERRVVARAQTAFGPAVVLELRCLGSAEGPAKATLERLMAERDVDALEPSVRCEGRQEVASSPFVPVRTVMHLTARPAAQQGGAPVEVTLDKTVTAERLE